MENSEARIISAEEARTAVMEYITLHHTAVYNVGFVTSVFCDEDSWIVSAILCCAEEGERFIGKVWVNGRTGRVMCMSWTFGVHVSTTH